MSKKSHNKIAFQGELGAYSHLACRATFPDKEPLPCELFEDAFLAVAEGEADLAMIPVENSLAGRVADIHRLLPSSHLHIIAEYFAPIHHHLLALPGAELSMIKKALSHTHALGQCHKFLKKNGIVPETVHDTAGAAALIAQGQDKTMAAIASELAGELYGLISLASNIEDAHHNATRFLIMSPEPQRPSPDSGPCMTSFIFKVRNIPAALYKGLGGFATNGINITKLESYQIEGSFKATQFYADVEGHPDDIALKNALDELSFFSQEVRLLGVYPAHKWRR
jgi:prephenate dehydratase